MALSMDLREKVMKAIRGGMSCRQAATRFDIGPATAVRWAKRVEITGEVAPGKMGGDRRSRRIEAHADFILAQIKETPDMTIVELRDALRERHDFAVGYGTMWRFLARHGITRKKKTGHAAEQERDDVAAAREEWFEGELDRKRGEHTLCRLSRAAFESRGHPELAHRFNGERDVAEGFLC
ncbi:hypothetical+protein [Methylocapsa aurea]